jgi:hypothetical protein
MRTYSDFELSASAKDNAEQYKHLADTDPGEQVMIEVYVDDPQDANYVIQGDQLVFISPALSNTGSMQIWGDTEPLYIQVEGKPELTRHWTLPKTLLGSLTKQCDALDTAIANLAT